MVDLLTQDGRIVTMDEAQAGRLGYATGAAEGQDWSFLYPLESRERIETLFAEGSAEPRVVALHLRDASGALVPVSAVAERIETDQDGSCLVLHKWPSGGALDEVARLAEEREVISGILAASDDAGWCMEWTDPVDLSAPEQEIIRQVFENGPRWRFCNRAMAHLYRTPEGEDFNARPVHETFPRTRENEGFIRRLIRASFDINGTPSRDLRYDGVYIEVENDVRGHIRGNHLYRMWGTVRDVSKHMRRAAVLKDEIDRLTGVIAALPDPLLVLDRTGAVLMSNHAAEELFGLSSDAIAARGLADLVDAALSIDALFEAAGAQVLDHLRRPLTAKAMHPEGQLKVEVTARIFDHGGHDLLALILRAQRRVPVLVEPSTAFGTDRVTG
ncbi:PAS domain-containing protein [Defluviimonas sp. WL0075]|uniref:PAS domain-containing protein n=2 Tax=Albidovulum sediminicola TaxID=2984331 RepID=A0ABT2Z6P4_9RHOB|nr:PAS domain-containing protein [Defluviimonas sp. WL0075]